MKNTRHELDTSWLAGKWTLADGTEVEVNTRVPYFAYGDFFSQGESADEIINEIHQIWLKDDDCTEIEACQIWAKNNL